MTSGRWRVIDKGKAERTVMSEGWRVTRQPWLHALV
jgi:hypothetical protein